MYKNVITITPNPALDVSISTNSWLKRQVNLGIESKVHAGGKGVNVAINIVQLFKDNLQNTPCITATGWLGENNDKDIYKYI